MRVAFAVLVAIVFSAEIYAEEIAMKGELVCEQNKPDEDGRIRLVCSLGFHGDDGKSYMIRPSKEMWGKALDSPGTRVLIKGTLVSGLITYTSIEPISE